MMLILLINEYGICFHLFISSSKKSKVLNVSSRFTKNQNIISKLNALSSSMFAEEEWHTLVGYGRVWKTNLERESTVLWDYQQYM